MVFSNLNYSVVLKNVTQTRLQPLICNWRSNTKMLTMILFLFFFSQANALHATNNLQIIPDFSLKDSRDQTVLGLALWTGVCL